MIFLELILTFCFFSRIKKRRRFIVKNERRLLIGLITVIQSNPKQ